MNFHEIENTQSNGFSVLVFLANGWGTAQELSLSSSSASSSASVVIAIRTEPYPRLPYSSAIYYLYEKGGKDIFTELEVCDKFDSCESKYVVGGYKAPEDIQTGIPYQMTSAVLIPKEKLSNHMCQTKLSLIDSK